MTLSDPSTDFFPTLPLVSVVVPTFNRADVLPRTLQSVLGQTLSEIELIVVDDGSTDNTAEVVAKINDPRLRFVPLGQNRGGNYARNQGIQASRADFVAFLDSDDEWLPQKLEKQLALINQDPSISVVYCQYDEHQEPSGQRTLNPAPYEGDVFRPLLNGWCPALSTFLIRRTALQAIEGFDESLPSFQDYDLFLRLAQAANKFAAVQTPLVTKYVHNSHQVSGNWQAKKQGLELFQARWGATMKTHVGEQTYQRWVAKHMAFVKLRQLQAQMNSHQRLAALGCWLDMIEFLPWSRKTMLKGLAFCLLGSDGYGKITNWQKGLAK